MEIEAKLENIDKKIENYNDKIDSLSSLITTMIHSFQQNKSAEINPDILNSIEEKLKDTASFPDINGLKDIFEQIQQDFSENQSGLKIKIAELENAILQINHAIDKVSVSNGSMDETLKIQLTNVEEYIAKLTKEIASLKKAQAETKPIENSLSAEKLGEITNLLHNQNSVNAIFQKNIETDIQALENKIKEISSKTSSDSGATSPIYINTVREIKEKFEDLNLAITSVLSAIKIIDKKYTELRNFQDVIDKLTTDVVSPILHASNDIRTFISEMSENFNSINKFVAEYDQNAFENLQNRVSNMHTDVNKLYTLVNNYQNDALNGIDGINENVEKISQVVNEDVNKLYDLVDNFKSTTENNIEKLSDTLNIDVNKLFNLVDEFKTNSDLSNHTISDNMEKIENMLTEYNENLEELTKTATADYIKDGVKTLNDEFYFDLLNLFNSLSFDEEAEDLKDFMQEVFSAITVKTNENSEKLNNIMLQFKSLLNKVEDIEKAQNSISDYLKPEDSKDLVYSFEDIQTDLANMGTVLNEISKSVTSSGIVEEISEKLQQTNENVSKLLSDTETSGSAADIKKTIEYLNQQVYDISLRTNKLILSSEDSNLELKNNLESFREVFDKANPQKLYELFYELTHYLTEINEKLNSVTQTSKASHTEAVTIKNALVYVGEWLDNATNVLEEIRSNTNNVSVEQPNLDGITKKIDNIKKEVEKETSAILSQLQAYEENTQRRLDAIEEKLDRLIAATSESSSKEASTKPLTTKLDSMNKKFGQMEKALAKLSDQIAKE